MVNLQGVRYLKHSAVDALRRMLAEDPISRKDIKGAALG
jgi:hypothetical protein